MAKGVKTGGRVKGVPNKATADKVRAIEQSGLTPLDYMLSVMRDTENPTDVRIDAAKSAAPYVHSKMPTAVEMSGPDGKAIQHVTKIELIAVSPE